MIPCLVESVVCSVEDALAAQRTGAGRVELCSAIELGGLTPSVGLVREVVDATSLPVFAMLRPRPGGFVYTEPEVRTMERDAEAIARAGVQGVVFAAVTSDGRIDEESCGRILARTRSIEATFHRAFDYLADPFMALDRIVELGFSRVLTSGCSSTALEGATTLHRLRDKAAGRIQILAGGSIRAENVRLLLQRSGVDQVHLGPFVPFGSEHRLYGDHLVLDTAALEAVVQATK